MTQRVKCFIVWRILPENSDWSEPVAVICTAPWCVTMTVYEQRRCAKRVAELRHRLEIRPGPRERFAREAAGAVRPVHQRQVRSANEGRILRHDQPRQ